MTLIACTWSLQAQTRTYHGTVLDAANNEPLIGATIMPIGGGQGVAADLDGQFTLTVPANVKKATISYVGYTSKQVDLQDNMTYYLASSATSLDDLVVVAYGTATKESLTGSIAVVGSKDIEDRPVTTATQALEGNAPGVQVNSATGTPGSEPAIRIRGFNSINGSNAPLYVVDGIPYDGSISDINPADIESMSVLKDAASCALYGNRGANGVILITTKKAKSVGKIDVNLSIRQGAYMRGLPFYDRLDANQWMQVAYDAQVNGGVYTDTGRTTTASPAEIASALATNRRIYQSNFIQMYARNNVYGVPDNELFSDDGVFFGGQPLPGYTDLDWWDAVARTGYRQEYNVSAAGATEKFNIFGSVGYMKEEGYTYNTDFERYSARINANFNPVSYFKFGVNLNASQTGSNGVGVDSSNLDAINNPFLTQTYAPIFPSYSHNEDGSIMYDAAGNPVWNTAGYLLATNVAWEMRLNKNTSSVTKLDGTIYGTAVLPYNFELTVRGQMTRDKTDAMEYNNNVVGSQRGSGMITDYSYDTRSHTFMQTLDWSHEYGLHHVDALLNHENYEQSSEYFYVQKSGQILPDLVMLNNFSNLMYGMDSKGKLRRESYLGRGRYNYNQQYFFEASIRRDGTSKFAKNNRWGNFWSVGASWIITKEKFMQELLWLNYLKLRASYGSVGNDLSAPTYSYYNLYGWNTYDNVSNLMPSQLAVNRLKWEATKTLDVALEGSLFNDRFNFSVGYFNKRNSDLLFSYVLPLSYGLTTSGTNPAISQNVGSMANYGWELAFGVDIIRSAEFNWNFKVDATFLKNKIKKLPGGNDLPSQGLFLGRSLYEHINVEWAGVEQYSGRSMYVIDPAGINFINTNADGTTYFNEDLFNTYVNNAREEAAAGGSIFIEKDGKYYTSNPSWASSNLMGTALPTVYGSFSTNLSWKGINFGMLFTYSLGGKTLDSNYAGLMNIGSSAPSALHKDLLNAWTANPDPSNITLENNVIDPDGIPQLNSQLNAYNNTTSSRYLVSSSYLTLKNINISYDLPRKWMEAIKLQGVNIGFTCDNVFIVAKRKGMNPTYGFAGGQGNYYVPNRVYSFQLNVRF